MRALLINSVCGILSTGRICTDIADKLSSQGYEVKIAYGRGDIPKKYEKYAIKIGSSFDIDMHVLKTRIFDEHGFGSARATKKFLEWADKYNPDLLWLHNIHGYYINIELLFDWIKRRSNMQTNWTLHDCWAFTGHCAHFSFIKCEKWRKHCDKCPEIRSYPASFFIDNSFNNFERKSSSFTSIKKMKIITPSHWLANLVKQSFLKEYDIEVHYNKIDLNIFRPIPSNFREKYGFKNKIIILGVANVWNKRKGLDDFIKLSEMLNDRYVVVLVGLSKRQIKALSKKIINIQHLDISDSVIFKKTIQKTGGEAIKPNIENLYEAIIHIDGLNFDKNKKEEQKPAKIFCLSHTNNAEELAKIYSAADIFVNPTHEDNYPTVNLEAQACGTYVITYDTGGCRETLVNNLY